MQRVLLYILSWVMLPVVVVAQVYPSLVELPYYDCIKYDANVLHICGDSAKFSSFFSKLDSLALWGNNRINVVHIGGSHIQAGVFSNRMRMNFARLLPGFSAERGAIFPYTAANTNNPKNYTIDYSGEWKRCQNSRPPFTETLGLMGYSISTNDVTGSISFNLNPEGFNSDWKFNRLRLLASVGDVDLMPILIVDGDTIVPIVEDSSFVFRLNGFSDCGTIALARSCDFERLMDSYNSSVRLVDSVAVGENIDISLEDSVYSLDIGLESDNGLFVENSGCGSKGGYKFSIMGILPENDFNGISYHSLGVNGASLQSWLRCERLQEQLAFVKPDLVIMAVGVNDANVPNGQFNKELFKSRYNELLSKIYAVNPDCAVIFVTNNDCVVRVGRSSHGINKNSVLVQSAMYELAREHDGAVWDLFDIMGGLGSMSVWSEVGLANKDRVHFLVPGYNLLGDMLFNAIIWEWLYSHTLTIPSPYLHHTPL